ncbi:MAG: pyridoxamine 5'-phosphate oxidase family protein, partial [Proteobacteria bacterium]|nr:pyridoxamine 5'-phosphate oxidase family protein [Pseudomonadota bacterium]
MIPKKALSPEDISALAAETKVGLLATVNPQGLPHVTLITSLAGQDAGHVMWGQFSEGQSKKNVKENPNCAFFALTLDRKTWRGRAVWTHEKKEGPEFELYNSMPMFRYNAYFGIHTVHYMDLVDVIGPVPLPLARSAASLVVAGLLAPLARRRRVKPVMKPWARSFMNALTTLKFVAYVGDDGFPWIIPCMGCRAPDSGRLVFSPLAAPDEFSALAAGTQVAVFGMGMEAESVLMRGPLYWFS